MTVVEFIASLAKKDIRLWLEGPNLRFSAPEGAITADLRSELVARKAEVMAFLANAEKFTQAPIKPADRSKPLPLSFAQQRMWLLDQLEPGGYSYNMPAALRLTGQLDKNLLQKALTELVRRHESLRTLFQEHEGQPIQFIQSPYEMLLAEESLQHAPADQRNVLLNNLIQAEACTPFNLATGPLMRARLITLSATEHVFLTTLHHIISDGWSMGRLVQEVSGLYMAYAANAASPFPEPALQYADYAVWQRDWLQAEVLEKQLRYWRENLADTPLLQFPLDYVRPPQQSYRGAAIAFSIDTATTQKLNMLARAQGATLFMTVLAGFYALLYRYSGQTDLCIGTPHANRGRPELESILGCFVNTLALRVQWKGNITFIDLLKQVQQSTLGAYAHQDVPFERLVNELNVERDMSYSPIFQVMFILQNLPPAEAALTPNLKIEGIAAERVSSKFDFTLALSETENGLLGELEYCVELFKPETIQQLVAHYQQILKSIAATPEQPVATLALLSEAERNWQLNWNPVARALDENANIVRQFEQQAALTPNAVALIFNQHQLTYAELNAKANQLAHYLREKSVQANDRVAICLPRGVDMIIAVWGVLKAGAAYVPLDANYPADRLNYILQDASAKLLISNTAILGVLSQPSSEYLDLANVSLNDYAGDNLQNSIQADDLIYLIYTSGSTGQPKGAMVQHRGEINLQNWYTREAALDSSSRCLLISAFGFDLTQKNIFTVLLKGGVLVIPDMDRYDALTVADLIQKHSITLLNCAPSAFYPLLEDDLQKLSSLRSVFLGGEPIRAEAIHPWLKSAACNATLFNSYGPTECTDVVAYHSINTDEALIPLGRSVDNMQLYLLSDENELVPRGAVAEICVAGVGVGLGYLNKSDLTDAAFKSNPFNSDQKNHSQKLYRTGDLGKFTHDGQLIYVGRKDFQVKVRGIRIELGEIEAALRKLQGVTDSLVVKFQESLLGYVVVSEEMQLHFDNTSARDQLKSALPDFMIPSHVMMLAHWPLSPNGKIDRKALPIPDENSFRRVDYVAPRTDIEQEVCAVWEIVLKRSPIGAKDNFFDLGGHSLLATQILSKVRALFKVALPLKELFRAPTIEGLALLVERQLISSINALPPVGQRPDDVMIPLSLEQQRLWFLQQLEPDNVSYNMPAAVRIEGELDIELLERALKEIVRRHTVLRTRLVGEDDSVHQVIDEPMQWQLMRQSMPNANDYAVRAAVHNEVNRPFHLANDSLFRVTLIQRNAQDHIALLNMHHAVADGWSVTLLLNELITLYAAYAQGVPSPLPELSIQYADYAYWQSAHLKGEALENKLGYWKQQLADAPVLELPTDKPRPHLQSFNGDRIEFNLSVDTTRAIYALSRRLDATPFMTMLALFNVMLSRYSAQYDLCVGIPVANRPQVELEPLIGFFVNTLVIRTKLNENPSFVAAVAQIKENTLMAYANQEVPFERIVEAVGVARNLSRSPLFQVMFNFVNTPKASVVSAANLNLSAMAEEWNSVKFDLNLDITEDNGQMLGTLSYCSDLFERASAERMVKHYVNLLQSVLVQPNQPVTQIPMLDAAEQAELLHTLNATQRALDFEPIAQQFERMVEAHPQQIALSWNHVAFSYHALNQHVNQFAHYLQSEGVRAGGSVGICLDRTPELIIAILAAVKLGAAYVPMDTNYPAERLAYILEDCSAPLLITHSALQERFADVKTKQLFVDKVAERLAAQSKDNLSIRAEANTAFYLIYTSGSTGRPKGAIVNQKGEANLLSWYRQDFALGPADKALLISAIGFDLTQKNIFGMLTSGGTLVLPTDTYFDPSSIAQDIERHQITWLNCAPSAFYAVLEESDNAIHSLRYVFLGGESIRMDRVREWLSNAGHKAKLVNSYGPTECSDVVASAVLAPHDDLTPIGRPICNTQLYVLGEFNELLPKGSTGELCVAGEGVGGGYHNQAELTDKAFSENPFGVGKLYRTGDLCRYLPNGQLDYLGRKDFQIKIRGLRIELGDIEFALRQLPDVIDSVVIKHQEWLIGYVVRVNAEPLVNWKPQLANYLQEFMIPNFLVELEALPLSPNGKIDRKALPMPDIEAARQGDYIAARNATEEAISGIWCDVLKIERVSILDNFFDVGGHSLLATRVVARVKKHFDIDFNLRVLFDLATIEGMANYVDTTLWARGEGQASTDQAADNGDREDFEI